MIELLAPAGNAEKLKTALYFGADAVYLAGKKLSLRAFSDNFNDEELAVAAKLAHEAGKKLYVALNIYAHNDDFGGLNDYLSLLERIGADGVIVADAGMLAFVRAHSALNIHLSTQANTTNKYAAAFWREAGVKRIVLARELSLREIAEINDYLGGSVEIEAFVHGAMCISYSGRCLLSDYMAGRSANKGECTQSCRWEYSLCEANRRGEYFPIGEDGRGTYILSSRDLCMLPYLKELKDAGVTSFKIEGRVKSVYYLAGAINAYRRALDLLAREGEQPVPPYLIEELNKISHRGYDTGFYFGKPSAQSGEKKPRQDYDFVAVVLKKGSDGVWVEMRGRFKRGDELEVLSPGAADGAVFTVTKMTDERGEELNDAILVQQKLLVETDLPLLAGDILRKKAVD